MLKIAVASFTDRLTGFKGLSVLKMNERRGRTTRESPGLPLSLPLAVNRTVGVSTNGGLDLQVVPLSAFVKSLHGLFPPKVGLKVPLSSQILSQPWSQPA